VPHLTTYSASKSAGWSYSNAARIELAGQGTDVVGVHVGYVDTDLPTGSRARRSHRRRSVKAGLSDDQNLIYPGLREQFAAALPA
jgi:short-subunit dehydrogenase